ncbi:MAG: tyrosine--tRNA ligase [Patescibacteria group bacterium]|nr:tyrosine--tRNA ligase [Patescibacteria group bacterium]
MTIDERVKLIKEVGEEIVTEEELKKLLESGEELIAYDGFEPSGRIHIAQGLLRAININKMIKAGVKFKMWIADWHAMTNDKMGGDLNKLRRVGEYFIEVWKACGMDLNNVEFLWASDIVKDSDYWKLVIQVGRTNKLGRFIRAAEFMGREDSAEKLTAAQIMYPCMQVADIFMLGAKITQLGMDQRKVNMLAREIGPQLGFWKPIVVSHHMLMGLEKPSSTSADKATRTIEIKMSKSKPDTAVFMTDTMGDLQRKIGKAYCPPGAAEENPVLEYFKYIVFEKFPSVEIKREIKHGGDSVFNSYIEFEEAYKNGVLHPQDVKNSLIYYLNELLKPVREHFENSPEARKLKEEVEGYAVTR